MALPALILFLSLAADRIFGDPKGRLHPVALLGGFIGFWGRPELYTKRLQKICGILMALLTALLFSAPFYFFEKYAPLLLFIVLAPFLLKICFAWRCLEEHVKSVEDALLSGGGRYEAQMLVSRDTGSLKDEEILSAAYESMAENLVDAVISPLFYFTLFGLFGAAFYRAFNTMDAMLGYKDERLRIGWFSARMDDFMNYIPARFTGLVLLLYFSLKGEFSSAWGTFFSDRKKRAGPNGGIPMSLIAGGCGISFVKPGVYEIGKKRRSLHDAGPDILAAFRSAVIISAFIFGIFLAVLGGIIFEVIYQWNLTFIF